MCIICEITIPHCLPQTLLFILSVTSPNTRVYYYKKVFLCNVIILIYVWRFLRNVILFPRGIMCSKMKMPLYRGHRARQRSNKCIYFIPPFQRHSKQMYKSLETINNLLSGGNSSKANQNLLFIWFLKLSKQKSITPCERSVPYPFFNSETALSDSETQKRCLYMLCSQK